MADKFAVSTSCLALAYIKRFVWRTVVQSNVYMHLTNYAINKNSSDFNRDDEAGSKRWATDCFIKWSGQSCVSLFSGCSCFISTKTWSSIIEMTTVKKRAESSYHRSLRCLRFVWHAGKSVKEAGCSWHWLLSFFQSEFIEWPFLTVVKVDPNGWLKVWDCLFCKDPQTISKVRCIVLTWINCEPLNVRAIIILCCKKFWGL